MKIIQTIPLNTRVRARKRWNASNAVFKDHTASFQAPAMLLHLMRHDRIRLYPYSPNQVALQIYDDPNPVRLKATQKIIQFEIDQMVALDKRRARDYERGPHYRLMTKRDNWSNITNWMNAFNIVDLIDNRLGGEWQSTPYAEKRIVHEHGKVVTLDELREYVSY